MKILAGFGANGKKLWASIRGYRDGTLNVNASATSSTTVTPSDSTPLTFKALYIGTGGTVVIQHDDGTLGTYLTVPDGFILPVTGERVMAATTALGVVAMDW